MENQSREAIVEGIWWMRLPKEQSLYREKFGEDLCSGGGRGHNKADGARIEKRKVAENQITL